MKLLYFAWLRAKLGKGSEELVPPPSVTTVATLLDWMATLGPTYKSVLADRRVVRWSISICRPEHPVAPGDEVVSLRYGRLGDGPRQVLVFHRHSRESGNQGHRIRRLPWIPG